MKKKRDGKRSWFPEFNGLGNVLRKNGSEATDFMRKRYDAPSSADVQAEKIAAAEAKRLRKAQRQ